MHEKYWDEMDERYWGLIIAWLIYLFSCIFMNWSFVLVFGIIMVVATIGIGILVEKYDTYNKNPKKV